MELFKVLLLTIFCFCSSLLLGQQPLYKVMMDDFAYNFYEVVDEAERYFINIDKEAKGSGWKNYQRWKSNNEFKYYPSGERSNVSPYFVQDQVQKLKFNREKEKALFPNGWKDLGPYTVDSITGHYAAGLGRVEDIYINSNNPNIIYQGSRSGGFWRTLDGGLSWEGGSTDFLPGSGVNTIAVSPSNPDSILINVRNAQNGTSYGLYRSIDGGITWTQSNFNPSTVGFGGLGSDFQIYKVFYHPRVPNLIYIGTNKGVYRSSDNLSTWTRSLNSLDISQIAFHPTNDDIVYLYDSYYWSSNHDIIYRTTDGGVNWMASNNISGNNDRRSPHMSTSPDCPSCVYIAYNAGVWRSIDEGQNFTFLSNPNESCDGFAVSDTDTSHILYGYLDLEMSNDGGQTFNQVTYWSLGNTNGSGNGNHESYNNSTDYVHADLRIAKCVNGVFYIGTDGFVSKSVDNGTTWENIGEGVGIRENYRIGLSQSNQYVSVTGSQDNGTSIKNEGGWVEFYGADGMEAIVMPLNEDWMISSLQNGGRRRTFNGGASQDGVTPSGSSSGDWIAPLAYDPNNHFTIFDFRDAVYQSTEFGDSYSNIGTPSFTGNIKHAAIAENDSRIIVVARNENIEKSIDGGVTFSSIKSNLPDWSIQDIAFDPNNDDIILVVYGRYQNDGEKVFITYNGGNSWTNITHNLGDLPIRSAVIDHTSNSNIYLGAEVGVYTMPLGGNTWSTYNTMLPNVSVRELEINYGANTIKAATWGRGLFEYHLVGRQDYPAIMKTHISNAPSFSLPKAGSDQYVESAIHYNGNLTSVYTEWSKGSPTFDHRINMYNSRDTTWSSVLPLGSTVENESMFFRVVAVGDQNDTTMTYKFMYTSRNGDLCEATGNTNNGNLFIDRIELDGEVNASANNMYTSYSTPVFDLDVDSSYTLIVDANTGWSDNDFTAWIDFNKDNDFSENERVLYDINLAGGQSNSTFTVPKSFPIGDTTTMRVRLSYWGTTSDPCGSTLGEVEDYPVVIHNADCTKVVNTKDRGEGSLRAAIGCAESGDTITFDPLVFGDSILITSRPLEIGKSLNIFSAPAENVTISFLIPQMDHIENLFVIGEGIQVEMKDISINGAYGLSASAILNLGHLVLKDVVISNGGKGDILSTVKNIRSGRLEVEGNSKLD